MGFSSLTVNKCYFKNSPKAGLEPQTSESEATALPTEPQPLPNFGILSSEIHIFYVSQSLLSNSLEPRVRTRLLRPLSRKSKRFASSSPRRKCLSSADS